MAETIVITKDQLSSSEGMPSKLQELMYQKFEEFGSLNQMSEESGLHHHTVKNLLLNNGSNRKLSRSTIKLLSLFLNIPINDIERLQKIF